MAAGGSGGLSQLWTDWGIQILVLASFALQVLLLLIGGMRRRGLSAWQRVCLWLAYLLADSTAIYALGHLSITGGSDGERRLVAFWAPFLLLHLGGPHNITAYALEDNRLWLRHLQTLVVQALGAAYVLYKYMPGSGALLLPLASASMFVAGLAKYGERTWALRCANKSSTFSGGDGKNDSSANRVYVYRLLRRDMDDEEVLVRAHTQFAMCRSCFNDAYLSLQTDRFLDTPEDLRPYKGEDVFKLLEMELSLMYDALYTKAPVIHTWHGLCIHCISLAGTSAALCFFQLSRRRHGAGDDSRAADVVVSYVLLAGALLLETVSACRAVLSSRTCRLVLCKAEDCGGTAPRARACLRWLHRHVLSPLRKPFRPATRRLWRDAIGQYNLLHLCTRADRTGPASKLAHMLGLQDWWNKLHFAGAFSGSDSLPMRRLKQLLEETVRRERFAEHVLPLSASNRRGQFVLDRKQAFKGVARWTVLDIELDESIVIWHVATDILLWEYKAAAADAGHYDAELVEATRVLSNYMMFLLVAKPNMLPGRERGSVHLTASRIIQGIWQRRDQQDQPDNNPVRAASSVRSWWSKCCALNEFFHHEGPDSSPGISQAQKEKLAEQLVRGYTYELWGSANYGSIESLHISAAYLAKQLLHLGRSDTLELIFAVWVEIMLYAAEHGPRDSHARELGNGGEFITIVWLLVQHYNKIHRFKIA